MKKLFFNGTFHLMTDSNATASAVLTENGKITGLFTAEIPRITDCQNIDMQQNHIFPGFIDTHTHSFEGGLYAQSLNLSGVKSISDLLEKLDDYYHQKKHESATQLDTFRFDENRIAEKRFPTRSELDSVCPDLPLVLRRIDGHSCVVNSLAWNAFASDNPDFLNALDRGKKVRTDTSETSGMVFRGELNDKIVHWFHSNFTEQEILGAYKKASELALSQGITTVHTMVGDSSNSLTHYDIIKANLSKFDTEFILYPQSFNLKAALDAGAERIGGCILADGSLGSYTAALRQPYEDLTGCYGSLYHTNDFWKEFIVTAHKHNLQVAVHCIGDAAIKQINDIYLELAQSDYRDLRHELIHCELTPQDLLEEIVQSKAIPVMQPAFDMYWGGKDGFYRKVLGDTRYQYMNRFRSFIEKEVTVTGGSDWYITELDALQGISAAVNHNNTGERLNRFEAVKLYTVNAAMLSRDENRLGKISTGYDADFVVLDRNILSDNLIEKANILYTYKKSKLVYAK
jgi:predicted amidohydrolase YtcJ